MIFSPAAIGLKFINSQWGRYAMIALALLAALAAYGRSNRKRGRRDVLDEIKTDITEQTNEGRNAYHEKRREAPRDGARALIDGMRRNDGRWSRL